MEDNHREMTFNTISILRIKIVNDVFKDRKILSQNQDLCSVRVAEIDKHHLHMQVAAQCTAHR